MGYGEYINTSEPNANKLINNNASICIRYVSEIGLANWVDKGCNFLTGHIHKEVSCSQNNNSSINCNLILSGSRALRVLQNN